MTESRPGEKGWWSAGRETRVIPAQASLERGTAIQKDRVNRARRGGQPKPIAEALARVVERLGLGGGIDEARIFEEWEAAVGPEIARVARPHRTDGGTLIVHVKSSAWMNELSLRRREILSRINERRSRRRVSQLVFRIESQ